MAATHRTLAVGDLLVERRRRVEQSVPEVGDEHQIVGVKIGQAAVLDVREAAGLRLEHRMSCVAIDEPRLDDLA